MIDSGSVVILHLVNPTEKFWGILHDLQQAGVVFRGLSVESFEDFVAQAMSSERGSLGLSTLFVPMFRVERIYLDQQVGEVESYRQRFERRVGVPVSVYLGMEETGDGEPS